MSSSAALRRLARDEEGAGAGSAPRPPEDTSERSIAGVTGASAAVACPLRKTANLTSPNPPSFANCAICSASARTAPSRSTAVSSLRPLIRSSAERPRAADEATMLPPPSRPVSIEVGPVGVASFTAEIFTHPLMEPASTSNQKPWRLTTLTAVPPLASPTTLAATSGAASTGVSAVKVWAQPGLQAKARHAAIRRRQIRVSPRAFTLNVPTACAKYSRSCRTPHPLIAP
ncbi:MAG: hypothetical protein RL522_1188 [Pseudomonadota bacterium]